MKNLLLVSDLASRTNIKAKLQDYLYVKDLEQLKSVIAEGEVATIYLDLANQRFDLESLFPYLAENDLINKTVCFYPHIKKELAQVALKHQCQQVYARSRFFSECL